MIAQLQSVDPGHLKDWLIIALALLGAAVAIVTLARRPTTTISPQPLTVREAETWASKNEMLEVRARVAALEAVRERDIAEHRGSSDALRRELKADLMNVEQTVRTLSEQTAAVTGELRQINVRLVSIEQRLE